MVKQCSHNSQALAGCLPVTLGLAAASMIISGSIVLVGNTLYWLEKQGECKTVEPAESTS